MTADDIPAKLPCLFCGSQDSRTLTTRYFARSCVVWRRRECADCGGRFSTHEIYLYTEPALRLRPGKFAKST